MPISLLNVLNEIAALILASGAGFLSVFDKHQIDAMVLLFLRLHGQGLQVASIFWGFWLFPFGILVMRSGFLPRVLGVLLIPACFRYLLPSLTQLLLPSYGPVVSRVASIFTLGEVPIVLWLVFKGAKVQPAAAPAT